MCVCVCVFDLGGGIDESAIISLLLSCSSFLAFSFHISFFRIVFCGVCCFFTS